MVDIQKSIEYVEKNLGRELTDKEKQAAEMLGGFMNLILEKADKQEGERVVPVKELVRCKDCKYRSYYCTEATDGTALYTCHHPCANSIPRPENWYCADGKRKVEDSSP